MDWNCNISLRGRIVRGIVGLLALAGGWLLLRDEHEFWATGLIAFGILGLFEAAKGWCVLRAFGVRTPF